MTSSDDSHYAPLIGATPRMPDYLRPANEELKARTEAVTAAVSGFLHSPVRLAGFNFKRTEPVPLEPSADEVYDIISPSGDLAMRITMSAATVASVTRSLFGGEVTERPVLSGIALAFCRQVAAPLLGLSAPEYLEEDDEAPDLLEGYDVLKGEKDRLGTRPVVAVDLTLSLIQPPDLELKVEYPREYTDQQFAPGDHLGPALLQCLHFPITGVAGQTRIALGKIRSWKPGDEIQFPGCSISAMAMVVSTGRTKQTLAYGELGTEEGRKSVRLSTIREVGDEDLVAPNMGAAPVDFDMGAAMEMDLGSEMEMEMEMGTEMDGEPEIEMDMAVEMDLDIDMATAS